MRIPSNTKRKVVVETAAETSQFHALLYNCAACVSQSTLAIESCYHIIPNKFRSRPTSSSIFTSRAALPHNPQQRSRHRLRLTTAWALACCGSGSFEPGWGVGISWDSSDGIERLPLLSSWGGCSNAAPPSTSLDLTHGHNPNTKTWPSMHPRHCIHGIEQQQQPHLISANPPCATSRPSPAISQDQRMTTTPPLSRVHQTPLISPPLSYSRWGWELQRGLPKNDDKAPPSLSSSNHPYPFSYPPPPPLSSKDSLDSLAFLSSWTIFTTNCSRTSQKKQALPIHSGHLLAQLQVRGSPSPRSPIMTNLPSQHPTLSLHLSDVTLTPLITSSSSPSHLESLTSLTTSALTAQTAAQRVNLGRPQRIMSSTPTAGPSHQHHDTMSTVLNGGGAGSGSDPHADTDEARSEDAAPMLVGLVVAGSADDTREARRAAVRLERVGREFQREWAAENLERSNDDGHESG
ncbi:hypothetical protein G7046_g3663 [Stylonectria norvegica]|nr:hypothetical protein G7046_g3663 [Stylonectria norvegica]